MIPVTTAVIVVLIVVAKVLVWASAAINMVVLVEVLAISVRSDVVIGKLAGVVIIMVVKLLTDVNANVFASWMTVLEFAVTKP